MVIMRGSNTFEIPQSKFHTINRINHEIPFRFMKKIASNVFSGCLGWFSSQICSLLYFLLTLLDYFSATNWFLCILTFSYFTWLLEKRTIVLPDVYHIYLLLWSVRDTTLKLSLGPLKSPGKNKITNLNMNVKVPLWLTDWLAFKHIRRLVY